MSPRLSLVVAHVLGVSLGLLGGYLLAPLRRCVLPAGHLWVVGDETYVDAPLVELLASKIPPEKAGEWTLFVLRKFGIFLKQVSEQPLLPEQQGPLYLVREEASELGNDDDVQVFLGELVRLGVLQGGRRFRSWDAVQEGT